MSNKKILEARALFQRAVDGDLRATADVRDLLRGMSVDPSGHNPLSETMTTSDFPVLLGAGYGREMLQEYQRIAPIWPSFSRRVVVPDFRPRTLTEILGGRAGLTKVKEATEYPARALTEGKYEFKVEKYGDRIPLTWEMLINDDLGAFRDLPSRLATGARETEELVAISPLFNANRTGLNTAYFKDQAAPKTGALNEANLEAALLDIATRKDSEGRPIIVDGSILLVPPALQVKAERLVAAREIRRTEGNVTTVESNPLAGRLRVVVNPWIPIYAPNYTHVNTTWFVLPEPNAGRPGLATGFLRGNESPDLRVKADAGSRVGGGTIAPSEGSFDDDTIQYRVRHVTGGAGLVNIAAFASNGSVS